jgi:hypothetical protein
LYNPNSTLFTESCENKAIGKNNNSIVKISFKLYYIFKN